jgi:GNAT superfamily N-acetyltransferase
MEQITYGNLVDRDIPYLLPVVQHWVRDGDTGQVIHEEVDEIEQRMRGALSEPNGYIYKVGRTPHLVTIAMVGLRKPEERMMQYSLGKKPLEIVNFFVTPNLRGMGIGSGLLQFVKEYSKATGIDELILNSGPRYKETAWSFYYKHFGNPCFIAKDFYGEGGHAPIWSMDI